MEKLVPVAWPLAVAATFTLVVPLRADAQGPEEEVERVPVVGLPCEGCEAVFQGMPEEPTSVARIAPEDEPGEPMRILGTVYGPDGDPAPGIIVYAYHTNARGVYPRDERFEGWAARHGELRGWAITDEQGGYRFDTIRPASYPNRDTPAHVHMHVIEPGCCTYYIASIHFEDDPVLDPGARKQSADGRGGSGLVDPERNADGVWIVRRDIVLGKGVPGYPPPGRSAGTR